MAEDFVIVGSDGTEHHFPDGMNVQRAIQVVKNSELASANSKPLHEPTSYDEGYKQSLSKTIKDTGSGILKGVTSMFSREPTKTRDQMDAEMRDPNSPVAFDPAGAARKVIKGFTSTAHNLTTPEGGGEAIGNLLTLGAMGRAGDLVSKVPTNKGDVGRALQTVGDFKLNKPLETIKKVGQRMEKSAENVSPTGVDRYLPNASGTPDRGVPQSEMPTSSASEVDHHLPNQSGTPDTGIAQGEMPQGTPPVELDNIQDVLMRDAASKAANPIQTDRVPYGGVEVPHRIKKTRMGKEVANPFGKEEVAPVEDAAPVEAGGVTVTPDRPILSSPEVAGYLRRMFGSRDGGRMLNAADPKSGAETLKRLAPGPSRIPLVAQARINAMPQDQTLEDVLREIITSRSTLPPE